MSGTKATPPAPESIDLFGEEDNDRTEIASPNFSAADKPATHKDISISLDEEDDGERTQIEKKPKPS